MHGTTILSVRRGNRVVIGGDGQVTLGDTRMKGNARKVRRLHDDNVIAGFAGGTAAAFTLFERFEGKLQKHQGNLTRAAVELSKDWRTDRMLRRLEALLAVADASASLILSGTGDVIEPEEGIWRSDRAGLMPKQQPRPCSMKRIWMPGLLLRSLFALRQISAFTPTRNSPSKSSRFPPRNGH